MAAREPSRRRSEKYAAEDVGSQLLLSFDLIESLLPVGRGELENAVMGPARQEAEKIAHVGEGFDLVEPRAGEQRDEDGVDPGSVVATDEEPVSTAKNLPVQIQLANVVAEGKSSVVGDGLGFGNANGLLLLSWKIRDGPLDSEQSPNSREGVLGSLGIGFEGLE